MLEVTGLIDLTVSFVQPQTPGGVDAWIQQLRAEAKKLNGVQFESEVRVAAYSELPEANASPVGVLHKHNVSHHGPSGTPRHTVG